MSHLLIVSARFYKDFSSSLERGAEEVLKAAGATWDKTHVPGSLEIPPVIRFALETEKYDGFVALGCVIRGETYHFEVVCNESARGLMQLALDHHAAIGNGILTVENEAQAKARLNKGKDAAEAALALITLRKQFT